MSKKVQSAEQASDNPVFYKLSITAAKLRGMAHLIEGQRAMANPLDYEDVLWGVGQILNELSADIREIANEVESQGMKTEKKRRRRLKDNQVDERQEQISDDLIPHQNRSTSEEEPQ